MDSVFVNRADELESICSSLRLSDIQIAYIIGDNGIGKTSLLYRFYYEATQGRLGDFFKNTLWVTWQVNAFDYTAPALLRLERLIQSAIQEEVSKPASQQITLTPKLEKHLEDRLQKRVSIWNVMVSDTSLGENYLEFENLSATFWDIGFDSTSKWTISTNQIVSLAVNTLAQASELCERNGQRLVLLIDTEGRLRDELRDTFQQLFQRLPEGVSLLVTLENEEIINWEISERERIIRLAPLSIEDWKLAFKSAQLEKVAASGDIEAWWKRGSGLSLDLAVRIIYHRLTGAASISAVELAKIQIETLFASIYESLSPEQRFIVDALSVTFEPVDFAFLLAIDDSLLKTQLQVLEDIELLRCYDWADGTRYHLFHTSFKNYVYSRLPQTDKRELHLRIGSHYQRTLDGVKVEGICNFEAILHAIEHLKRAGDVRRLADVILESATLLMLLGLTDLLESDLSLALSEVDQTTRISLFYYLALTKQVSGEIEQAANHYRQVLDSLQDFEDNQFLAAAILGGLAHTLGQVGKMEDVINGLSVSREQANNLSDALSYQIKSHKLHLELYERLDDLSKKEAYEVFLARSAFNTAKLSCALKDYDRATEFFGEALRLDRKRGNQAGQAQDLRFLALISADTGEFEKGLEFHKKALRIHTHLNDTRQIAFDLANIGATYKTDLKDDTRGDEYLERALAHFEELGMLGEEMQVQMLLSEHS